LSRILAAVLSGLALVEGDAVAVWILGLPVAMERKVTLSAKSQCKCRSYYLESQRLKGEADERRRLDACRLLY
jgi:hypothetical protein